MSRKKSVVPVRCVSFCPDFFLQRAGARDFPEPFLKCLWASSEDIGTYPFLVKQARIESPRYSFLSPAVQRRSRRKKKRQAKQMHTVVRKEWKWEKHTTMCRGWERARLSSVGFFLQEKDSLPFRGGEEEEETLEEQQQSSRSKEKGNQGGAKVVSVSGEEQRL